MKKIKFNNHADAEFAATLKKRVNKYFSDNNLSKYGNGKMVVKTIVMLSMFLLPLLILNLGMVTTPLMLFVAYITSGLGMAGIGMGVMHDAIHGSYSHSRKLNKIMSYSMNVIGANSAVWKVQHNVLHHTYTNIQDADDDINAPVFLRFSPYTKRYWIHKFQFIYVWFFYGLSTLSWVTSKDFIRLKRYKNMGFFTGNGEYRRELVKMTGWKILYYLFALILPIVIVPLPFWLIIVSFLTMHFITGLTISLIFQLAHVMPEASFLDTGDAEHVDSNWNTHQLSTTTNFAPGSRSFTWLVGGLNYQVEHHLMPHISHVHYRKLAPIVEQTAKEYGIPYLSKKTFVSALWDHTKMLYKLGRVEQLQPAMSGRN